MKINSRTEGGILKKKWYYLFLIFFVVFVLWGLSCYYSEETKVSHFSAFSVKPTSNTTFQTQVAIIGEYKTKGGGFIAGKKITICELLLLDKETYQQVKTYYESTNAPKIVFVKNSEDPKDAGKDICENFEQLGFDECFVNPGTLEIVEFLDKENTIRLKGDVIFTKEGYLSLGMPIGPLLESYEIKDIGIHVAPRYVEHQIETNKRMEFLSFITIAIAFLALFFGFKNQKK